MRLIAGLLLAVFAMTFAWHWASEFRPETTQSYVRSVEEAATTSGLPPSRNVPTVLTPTTNLGVNDTTPPVGPMPLLEKSPEDRLFKSPGIMDLSEVTIAHTRGFEQLVTHLEEEMKSNPAKQELAHLYEEQFHLLFEPQVGGKVERIACGELVCAARLSGRPRRRGDWVVDRRDLEDTKLFPRNAWGKSQLTTDGYSVMQMVFAIDPATRAYRARTWGPPLPAALRASER